MGEIQGRMWEKLRSLRKNLQRSMAHFKIAFLYEKKNEFCCCRS